jgi:hypothetical protein
MAKRVSSAFYTSAPVGLEDNKDLAEISTFRKLSSDFLDFLSDASEQIPPADNIDVWLENRKKLIKFLISCTFLCIRIDIQKDDLESHLVDIHSVIKLMKNDISGIIKAFADDADKAKPLPALAGSGLVIVPHCYLFVKLF